MVAETPMSIDAFFLVRTEKATVLDYGVSRAYLVQNAKEDQIAVCEGTKGELEKFHWLVRSAAHFHGKRVEVE